VPNALKPLDPFDGELLFLRFLQACQPLHLQRKEVLLRLQQEVASATYDHVFLLFSGERPPPSFASARKIPLCFENTTYGMVLLRLHENRVQDALPASTVLLIASLCGFLLHTCELAWIVHEHGYRNISVQEHRAISRADFTKRQWEVLHCICQGETKEHIQQKLHITASTLQKHRQALYTLLRVKSEHEILITAFRLKLFSPLALPL